MRVDLIEIVARRLMGRPDARMCVVEWLNREHDGIDAARVEMRECPSVRTGPRAGRPNWKAYTWKQERIIPREELEAEAKAWSAETGLCIDCTGTGRQLASWNVETGTKYKPCATCDGTGGPGAEPAEPDLTLFEVPA